MEYPGQGALKSVSFFQAHVSYLDCERGQQAGGFPAALTKLYERHMKGQVLSVIGGTVTRRC
jgi:hypothetical protein